MKYIKRTLLLISIVLISLLCISSISASEIGDSTNLNEINNGIEIVSDLDSKLNTNSDLLISDTNSNSVSNSNSNSNSNIGSNLKEESQVNDSVGTFTNLKTLIDSSSNSIKLNSNYKYSPGDTKDGIIISKNIEIDGNGYSIDGDYSARIFNITAGNTVTLKNIKIINANSSSSGGAIYSNGNIIASNTLFDSNSILSGVYAHYYEFSYYYGGAIYTTGDLILTNCNFTSNIGEFGSVLYSSAKSEFTNCNFIDNVAKYGLYYDPSCGGTGTGQLMGGTATLLCNASNSFKNCTFKNNINDLTSDYGYARGIGVIYSFSNCSVEDCDFENNDVASVIKSYGTTSILNSNFINNLGYSYGEGGVVALAANGTINNCKFINTTPSNYGGAIYLSQSTSSRYSTTEYLYTDVKITNSEFTNNQAIYRGGAIYSNVNHALIENCSFESNYVDLSNYGYGGAIYSSGFNDTIVNCSFIDNLACRGGAIYSNNVVKVFNSSFAKNYVNNKGINIYNIGTLTLSNNLMYEDIETKKLDTIATIYNLVGTTTGIIDSEVNVVALDNKTIRVDSLKDYPIVVKLSDDNNNLIESNYLNINFNNRDEHIYFNSEIAAFSYVYDNEENATYLITPSYSGTNNALIQTAVLVVGPIQTILNASFDEKIIEGSNLTVDLKLYAIDDSLLNETADLIIINKNNNAIIYNESIQFINGSYQDTISNLDIGFYTLKVNFDANEIYKGSCINKSFSVVEEDSFLLVEIEDIEVGEDLIINVSLSNKNCNVEVYITGMDVKNVNLVNGKGSLCVHNLKAGDYTVITKYQAKSLVDISKFTVSPVSENSSSNSSDSTDSNSTDSGSSSGNSTDSNSTDFNGTNSNSTDLDSDSNDTNQSNSTNSLIKTIISLDVKDIDFGENALINIELKDNSSNLLNKDILLSVDGIDYNLSLIDGKGNITLENLSSNDYTVVAIFLGDDEYSYSFTYSNFKVSRKSTLIEANDLNTVTVNTAVDGRIGKYFDVVLKDSDGNPLVGKAIKIGFNGVIYDRVTNATGEARLQINLKNAGTYTFAIAFLGDDDYSGSFEVSKIIVKTQKPVLTASTKSYSLIAKTKSISATFKSSNNNFIVGKKISFTINGKTYAATTNSKGVATVNVSLNKKGTYSFTAKFAGDTVYSAVTNTAKLTIK